MSAKKYFGQEYLAKTENSENKTISNHFEKKTVIILIMLIF
jgi:hypothetical protein